MVAEKLMAMGATTVTGLFLAKTINPDYTPYLDPAEFYEEEQTYDCYNGSYAQDVEGWSDQAIDEVFDGDPEAYWNID